MSNPIKSGLLTLFLSASFFLTAQDSPDKSKIKALKIAFFTERLSLTTSEAEVFWPLYNTYEEKRDALRDRQHREVFDKIDNIGKLSESESRALLKRNLDIEAEEEAMDALYYTKIADAISAKKTLLLFRAEHEFWRQLMRQMRQKQNSKGN